MTEKMTAVIKSVSLNEKTYHNVIITPTLINFFFGKNGAGKTTIANSIKNMAPGLSEYDVLVYDRDFIARNIKEDKALPGVFSINEEDIEKQIRIDEKRSELQVLGNQYAEKKAVHGDKINASESLKANLTAFCWKATADMRTKFPHAMEGKRGSKSVFLKELLNVKKPKVADLDELQNLYDMAYGSDLTHYSQLQSVTAPSENTINGFSLLDTAIVSSSDKPFATFIRTIGAADWLHRGHEQFANSADGKCPYCGRLLQDDYEEQFAFCFDRQYETDLEILRKFVSEYKKRTNHIISVLKENTEGVYPKIDLSKYNDKLDTLVAVISLNKKKLDDKLASPTTSVAIDSIDALINEINGLIADFNTMIGNHNSIIASRHSKQDECKNAVWQHMAALVANDVINFRAELAAVNTEIAHLNADMKDLVNAGNILKAEIADLSKKISGIDPAVESINKMLSDSGFQGFSLQKKGTSEEDKNKYMIVRDDQLPAHGLSEGERNFIAFLYFYHMVMGRDTSDGIFKERIVVIDDPVSSMDSNSLFIVSSIVRELVDICFNNGRAAKPDASSFIKQIFVLTHNAYFHREVSYDMIKYYHCVNFYLIKKNGNVSTIDLCVRKDPLSNQPAIEHNFNPVQNSYAALWHEYTEVTSAVALIRVIRQILEYYFIQISGYERTTLRERILKDEAIFIRHNLDGGENRDMLQSVNALLRYIGSDRLGFNDGLNYIDGSESPEKIKDTFELIFKAMGQEQHYRMMMETVK